MSEQDVRSGELQDEESCSLQAKSELEVQMESCVLAPVADEAQREDNSAEQSDVTPPSEEQNQELPNNSSEEIEDEDPEIDEDHVAALSLETKTAIVEAILLASGDSLSIAKISSTSKIAEQDITHALSVIKSRYESPEHGVELVCIAEQFQLRTKARFGRFVRALKASVPRRLSQAALETISIIAYRQPIVKSDIERIRGVDATPTIKTLIERGLVKIVGHQPTVGQPALYGTTDDFLKLFGLSSLGELPTLKDIKELEKDPGESGVTETVPQG